MMTLVALSSLAVGAGVWFVWTERRRGREVLELGARLEAQGAYEAACFHYAVAVNAGVARAHCEARIRELWEAHGPFLFSDTAEELRAKYCSYESCGEGYHQLTVGDIQRIVGTSRSGRS